MTTQAILATKGIDKRFGGIQALNSVDLNVREGTIHGLIGPNGAGKTTLFNVITGYLRPDSGAVLFRGEPLQTLPSYKIARKGVVRTFQVVKQLAQMSVYDNMKAGAYRMGGSGGFWPRWMIRDGGEHRGSAPQHERIVELLEEVGLSEKARLRASALSFGELRFLDVARALVSDPAVLLVDEPAAGLNREEVIRLENVLLRRREASLSTVIIEHDVELVFRLCDEITVLDFGKVICTGGPDAVSCDPAVMAAYLGEEADSPGTSGPAEVD